MSDTNDVNPLWLAILAAIPVTVYLEKLPTLNPVILVLVFAMIYFVADAY